LSRFEFKLKFVLPKKSLLKIYYSLTYPHLLYDLVAWGSTFSTYLAKLSSLQNKAIKLIGGGTFYDNATPFYSKLNVLKLSDLYKLETGKLIHRFVHKSLLPFFTRTDYFKRSSDISTRTRSSTNPNNLPRYKTNRIQRSIKFQGVKIWNQFHK